MRELKMGASSMPVRATPLTMLFYKQEFDADMTKDYMGVMNGFLAAFPSLAGKSADELAAVVLDPSEVTAESIAKAEMDVVGILKLVWAMGKAAVHPQPWPCFENWVVSIGEIDVFDVDFLAAALAVAADGLFRRRH